jgi:AcrR family transcriptional regulator
VEQTRTRILDAARDLLMAKDGFSGFTVDAVSRHADVARMTVYYQFGSKVGLLEALCDTLGAKGGMQQLAGAFHNPEPWDALVEYIHVFSRFWTSDRIVIRRLRGLATLDPDFNKVIQTRDDWRRKAIRSFLQRISDKYHTPKPEEMDETVNILFVLFSFETFDHLAGDERSPEEVAPLIVGLTRAALGLEESRET